MDSDTSSTSSEPINMMEIMDELFTDRSYVDQEYVAPSGNTISYLSLRAAFTSPDLTGQILWPGCQLLLSFIDHNLSMFTGKRCLELGAGTGVCSNMIGKYANPSTVVCTDGSDVVTELIEKNIEFNKLSNIVKAYHLSWTEEECSKIVEKEGKFDIVFGSEIAYKQSCIKGLVTTMDSLLKSDGRFIIGHINRYYQVTREFYKVLKELNFEVEKEIEWDSLMPERLELIEGSVLVIKRSKA